MTRDIPITCPAEIVIIDRDVPGNAADRIWAAPIQIAWSRLMSSTRSMRGRLNNASTAHMTAPPISSAAPIMGRFSRCLEISFSAKTHGPAVTTNAMIVRLSGCVHIVRVPLSPLGKVLMNLRMRPQKYTGKAKIAPNWITTAYIFQ